MLAPEEIILKKNNSTSRQRFRIVCQYNCRHFKAPIRGWCGKVCTYLCKTYVNVISRELLFMTVSCG